MSRFVEYALLSLCLCAFFIACRKDPTIEPDLQPDEEWCECAGEKNSPGFIMIGDTTGMRVELWNDTLFENSYSDDSLFIDLELDGEIDFYILSSILYNGMGGGGVSYHGQIGALNDSGWVGGTVLSDTMYMTSSIFHHSSNPVIEVADVSQTCYKMTCCDSIAYMMDHLDRYASLAIINTNQSWLTAGSFRRTGWSTGFMNDSSNPDTTFLLTSFYDPSCNNLTSEAPYIGIKKISCGQTKLGWVKLQAGNPWKIVETAIQR